MGTDIWLNIGPGYALLPGGSKPLPEQMPTGIHLRAISMQVPKLLSLLILVWKSYFWYQ